MVRNMKSGGGADFRITNWTFVSSYILLFVKEVVNNAALKFLHHTTKLGKMFPNSDSFPHLVRDALKLNPKFPDRHSEVTNAITNPTHKDRNDEQRSEIAAVFPPEKISVFELKYQSRNELESLPELSTGPYYDSVQTILSRLDSVVRPKLTPRGMKMCGGDLAELIKKLFVALDSGNVIAPDSAYTELEKQMCDCYYSKWISPLSDMSDDEFMSKEQQHLEEFDRQCKIDSYAKRVKREIKSRKEGIIELGQETKKHRMVEKKLQKAEADIKALQRRRRHRPGLWKRLVDKLL